MPQQGMLASWRAGNEWRAKLRVELVRRVRALTRLEVTRRQAAMWGLRWSELRPPEMASETIPVRGACDCRRPCLRNHVGRAGAGYWPSSSEPSPRPSRWVAGHDRALFLFIGTPTEGGELNRNLLYEPPIECYKVGENVS